MPLFQELAPAMVKDLETYGLASFPRTKDVADELLDWLRTRQRRGQLGRRIAMSRYGGSQSAAVKGQGLWHVRLFERTYLALEMDMLKGKRLVDKISLKLGLVDPFYSSTNPNKIQVDEDSSRLCPKCHCRERCYFAEAVAATYCRVDLHRVEPAR